MPSPTCWKWLADLEFVWNVLQGAALLGGVNALHTAFPDDPEQEYQMQGIYLLILETH